MAKYNYITKECLFCDGTNAPEHPLLYKKNFKDEDLNAEVFSARRTTEHFHYEMVKCKRTGLIFSRHILDDESLNKLYKGSVVTFGEQTEFIKKDYWKPLTAFVNKWHKGKA